LDKLNAMKMICQCVLNVNGTKTNQNRPKVNKVRHRVRLASRRIHFVVGIVNGRDVHESPMTSHRHYLIDCDQYKLGHY